LGGLAIVTPMPVLLISLSTSLLLSLVVGSDPQNEGILILIFILQG
jgi:hypothetical protein